MAEPIRKKNRVTFEYFENSGGLNTRGNLFNAFDGQCRENLNIKYPRAGGFSHRGGQANVVSTPPSGGPGILFGKQFRRFSSGVYTSKRLAFSDDGKFLNYETDPPTAIATGLSGDRPDAVVYGGWFAYVNGTDTPKKWDMTNLRNWGILAPSSAPSVATGAAGSPNGSYRFAVAYERQGTAPDPGHYSSLGVFSSVVSPVNQQVDLSSIPVSSDGQVTHKRVAVEINGIWYFIATITNASTTYTYDMLDSDAIEGDLARFDRDPPPTSLIYVEVHKDIVFGTDGTFLYWTALGEFESWDVLNRRSNAFEVDDGTRITGLKSFGDVLVVSKERSLFTRAGDDINYAIEKKPDNYGCLARHSMVVRDRKLYCYSHEGFISWDGTYFNVISPNVEELLFSGTTDQILFANRASEIVGTSYVTYNHKSIIWTIPTGSTTNTKAMVYFPDHRTLDVTDTKRRRTVGAWSVWDSLNAIFLFTTIDITGSFNDGLFQCGDNGHLISLDSGYDDLGSAINCAYRDIDHPYGEKLMRKRLSYAIFAITRPEGSGDVPLTPNVEWYVDGIPSGAPRQLNFQITTGSVFDTAVFDLDTFALEAGSLFAVTRFGANPFKTLSARITWAVNSVDAAINWIGWAHRVIPAGYRRSATP